MGIGTTAAIMMSASVAANAAAAAAKAKAAKAAAKGQATAAGQARQMSAAQYQQSRAAMKPYAEAGAAQVRRLSDMASSGGYFKSPEQARAAFLTPQAHQARPVPLRTFAR